jgi:hypothetical protein
MCVRIAWRGYIGTMETTNTETSKSVTRRTYVLAGIPCICFKGSLYAPPYPYQSPNSVFAKLVVTAVDDDDNIVDIQGPAGSETWIKSSREQLKLCGQLLRESQQELKK